MAHLHDWLNRANAIVRNPQTLPSTIDDIIHDVAPPDRETADKVRRYLEKELAPQHGLAAYVNKTVFPLQDKKSIEKWAKDVPDVRFLTRRTAHVSLSYLHGPLARILAASDKVGDDSPRKLSDELTIALEDLQDVSTTEEAADKVMAALHAALADLRILGHEAHGKEKAVALAEQLAGNNFALTKQLLLRDETADRSESRTTNGATVMN
jgi:hypothetical protein